MFKKLAFGAALIALALGSDPSGDGSRTFQQICIENNYDMEEHTVITEDGYILTVFRIPGKSTESKVSGKPVVLFQHGVFDSADGWIMNYADKAPAFVAVNDGYDVWLNNSRGNKYSRAHTTLNPNKQKFWFTDWEDMGLKDQPAVMEYITRVTGQEKVTYVGHSQGTTQFFSALSQNNSYFADHVNLFVALAPITKIPNTQSGAIQFAAWNYRILYDAIDLVNYWEMLPDNWATSTITNLFCNNLLDFCILLEEFFATDDPSTDDKDRCNVYFDHFPAGTPTQSVLHYGQNVREDRFQVWAPDYVTWFDIGAKKQTDLIPLQNIDQGQVPVAMIGGDSDILGDVKDTVWTKDQIANQVVYFDIIHGGHLTFMVGTDMSWFSVNVMDLIREYNPLNSILQ